MGNFVILQAGGILVFFVTGNLQNMRAGGPVGGTIQQLELELGGKKLEW